MLVIKNLSFDLITFFLSTLKRLEQGEVEKGFDGHRIVNGFFMGIYKDSLTNALQFLSQTFYCLTKFLVNITGKQFKV